MNDFTQNSHCVYNGIEYKLTGRRALNAPRKKYVFELKPAKTFGFDDELNIWVPADELFIIEKDIMEIKND